MTKFNKKLAMQWQYHVMLVPAIVMLRRVSFDAKSSNGD